MGHGRDSRAPWAPLPQPGQSTPMAPCRYTAASVIDTASKYKLLWKLPLGDADIIKGGLAWALPGLLAAGPASQRPPWRV